MISTPYPYAKELLGEGRGLLIPFADSPAVAEGVLQLLDNDVERQAMQERAYRYGRRMRWPYVASDYMRTFQAALAERARVPQPTLFGTITNVASDRAVAY